MDSPFNVEDLAKFAISEIEKFSVTHKDEKFYGFCIDASLLCLNSVEQLRATAANYERTQEHRLQNSPLLNSLGSEQKQRFLDQQRRKFRSVTEWESQIRYSIGDWEYQGFADMAGQAGFDFSAYQDHYQFVMDLDPTRDPTENFDGPPSLFIPDAAQKTTYGIAMNQLLELVASDGCLKALNKTDDFRIFRVEHSY